MAIIRKKFHSVIQIDSSFFVCLPKEYATAEKITKGDIMESMFNGGIVVYRHIKNLSKATLEKELADAVCGVQSNLRD